MILSDLGVGFFNRNQVELLTCQHTTHFEDYLELPAILAQEGRRDIRDRDQRILGETTVRRDCFKHHIQQVCIDVNDVNLILKCNTICRYVMYTMDIPCLYIYLYIRIYTYIYIYHYSIIYHMISS